MTDVRGGALNGDAATQWRHVSEAPGFATLFALSQEADARRAELIAASSWSGGLVTDLTLTTVYHKLVPLCGPVYLDASNAWRGEGRPMTRCHVPTAFAASSHVFDLVTSTVPGACHGQACTAAAAAVRELHALLDRLTSVRTTLFRALWSTGDNGTFVVGANVTYLVNQHFVRGDYIDQFGAGPRVRGCGIQHRLIHQLVEALQTLPGVLERLRRAAPSLGAVCVAPPRRVALLPNEAAVVGVVARAAIAELSGAGRSDPSTTPFIAHSVGVR